jgi:DNA invertase Pin-like site-specific DNA recombinase
MADVRSGVVREVWAFKLDRLARTGVADMFRIVDEIRHAGATLYAVGDNLCIRPGGNDIVSETMVFALGLAAKIERTAINDRVAAARARMEAKGEPWGRPPRMTPKELETARRMHGEGRSVREIAQALGVPRSTAGRAVRRVLVLLE